MFSTGYYFDTSCYSRFVTQTSTDLRKDSIGLLFVLIRIDFKKARAVKPMILNHTDGSLLDAVVLCGI